MRSLESELGVPLVRRVADVRGLHARGRAHPRLGAPDAERPRRDDPGGEPAAGRPRGRAAHRRDPDLAARLDASDPPLPRAAPSGDDPPAVDDVAADRARARARRAGRGSHLSRQRAPAGRRRAAAVARAPAPRRRRDRPVPRRARGLLARRGAPAALPADAGHAAPADRRRRLREGGRPAQPGGGDQLGLDAGRPRPLRAAGRHGPHLARREPCCPRACARCRSSIPRSATRSAS